MNDTEFLRYSRQIFIEDVGVAGQRKIGKTKVLVIGAGGLGSPVLQYLAAAGIGTLGVIDFDQIEIHNLNRQTIHQDAWIGAYKVDSAADFVRKLNPNVMVNAIKEQLTMDNAAEWIAAYDIIVDGSDNFETRYVVNDVCVALKKTLVYGSVYEFEGQLAVFNYEGSKNLRDLFPEIPTENSLPNCDSRGVLGPLTGMVGSMMAMLVLQICIGIEVPKNQFQLIDSRNWKFTTIKF